MALGNTIRYKSPLQAYPTSTKSILEFDILQPIHYTPYILLFLPANIAPRARRERAVGSGIKFICK